MISFSIPSTNKFEIWSDRLSMIKMTTETWTLCWDPNQWRHSPTSSPHCSNLCSTSVISSHLSRISKEETRMILWISNIQSKWVRKWLGKTCFKQLLKTLTSQLRWSSRSSNLSSMRRSMKKILKLLTLDTMQRLFRTRTYLPISSTVTKWKKPSVEVM